MSPGERYIPEIEGSRNDAPSHLIHFDAERFLDRYDLRQRVKGSRRRGRVTRALNT